MSIEEKENNRLWHLLSRKVTNEITAEEGKELADLLQQYPFASYIEELISQKWKDSYKSYTDQDIELFLEKHKRRMQDLSKVMPLEEEEPEWVVGKKHTISTRILRYAAVAAACVLLTFAGWKWSGESSKVISEIALQQLVTPNGSRSRLMLPDGTKVWLNSGSKLDYPDRFDTGTRDVTLTGEAFFEVTKDVSRPFLVHTKTFDVRVVGTSFNVRAYADEDSAETSLINGVVEVQFKKNKDNKSAIVLKPNEKLTIPTPLEPEPGRIGAVVEKQRATDDLRARKVAVTSMEDPENTITETAWVNNKLAFKNTSFEKIVQSLEKWFGVRIEFKNEDKKTLRLRGTFEGESLDEILQAFQITGKPFKYKKDDGGTIWIE